MKVLTDKQKAVLAVLRYSSMPLTVREIAQSRADLTDSGVRSSLKTLLSVGAIEEGGPSFAGGRTWTILGRINRETS